MRPAGTDPTHATPSEIHPDISQKRAYILDTNFDIAVNRKIATPGKIARQGEKKME